MVKHRTALTILAAFLLAVTVAPVPLEANTSFLFPQVTGPVTVSDTGPWLLFRAKPEGSALPYLWGINADGTGLTRLSPQPVFNFAVHPYSSNGSRLVAYVGSAVDDWHQDLALYLLSLPDGKISMLTRLLPEETNSQVDGDEKYEVAAGLTHPQGLAWSPDGRWLAFVGAINGTSADLYSYELATGTIRWLSDGPAQAYQLSWTADSRQIIHSEKSCFFCAGGPYDGGQGVWGAAPDGSTLVTYEEPAAARFVTWKDATHLLMDTGPRNGGVNGFRILDITSNRIDPIDLGFLEPMAYDDTGRHALGYYHFGDTHLLQEGQGLYLVDIDARQATFLRDIDADGWADIWWDRYEQRFLLAGDLGLFSITTDGTLTSSVPATSRVPSPDGHFSASFYSAPRADWAGGLWLQTGHAEPEEVLDGGGLSLEWSPDSRSFFYDQGYSGLYLVVAEPLAIMQLAERSAEVENWQAPALDWQATWVSN